MLVYSIVYPSTHWIVYLICGLYISRKKSRCFFVIFSCKCPFYCSLQAVSTEGDIDLTNHCCFKSTFAGPNIQSSVSFQGKCSYKRGRGWICNEFHVLQQTVVCLKEKKIEKKNWVLRRSSHDKQYKWECHIQKLKFNRGDAQWFPVQNRVITGDLKKKQQNTGFQKGIWLTFVATDCRLSW